tara:strand:+ start:2873 stop:6562 length:3690 start_codon:yes stop_codon:yes gene_type:complete
MTDKTINAPLYNISEYSDNDLYEILDLVNPSDRELEAKILMEIHKYDKIGSLASIKLSRFFNDIYEHFFDVEESDVEEGFEVNLNEDGEGEYTPGGLYNQEDDVEEYLKRAGNKYQLREDINEGAVEGKINQVSEEISEGRNKNAKIAPNPTKKKITIPDNMMTKGDAGPVTETTVGYTQDLEYSKGVLNPIMQQTTKRIVSIDSQYRSDKRTMSTEFTFNLSEPLKDVISLKLYSIQIPYTWYTIGKAYGNNFFFFKGRTPGIDTGFHDLQIEIEPGNYKPAELITEVNDRIKTIREQDPTNISEGKIYPIDVSMGLTELTYNKYTSLTTMAADLSKSYNESSYSIEFPAWSSPYETYSPDIMQSIPGFLGLQTDVYYSNNLKSVNYYNVINEETYEDIDGTDSSLEFTVDDNNKNVTIELYKGDYTSSVDNSFNIVLDNGTYTRKLLIQHVNEKLINTERLINSGILWKNLDARNSVSKSYIELTIKLKRTVLTNLVNENPKIKVIFPTSVPNIWYGEESCFGFYQEENKLNEIISEESPSVQSYRYPITTSPYILLKSNVSRVIDSVETKYFDNIYNDISFNVENSIGYHGYLIDEYMDKINKGIRDYDAINDNICKSPDENYHFESTEQDPFPTGTYAYMKDNKFNLYLDINKTYDERYYEIDLTGGVFDKDNGIFTFKDMYGVSYGELTDLTETYTARYGASAITINPDQLIFTIKPKKNGDIIVDGNEHDVDYELRFTNSSVEIYGGYIAFKKALHVIFTGFRDPISNVAIFEGLELSETLINQEYNITFTPKINKKLIAKNYDLQFVDPNVDLGNINGWEDNLYIHNTMAYNEGETQSDMYDMSLNLPSSGDYTRSTDENGNLILSMDDEGKVNISGYSELPVATTIKIQRGINDVINFIGYEEGVFTRTEKNNVSISIPPGTYSRDSLIYLINQEIQSTSSVTSQIKETTLGVVPINEKSYVKIKTNITRNYNTEDFNVLFYDNTSFATCTPGVTSVQNATWDTTIGWIMGFREYTLYDMSAEDVRLNNINNVVTIRGDTGLSTNLFNYFLICLDDYNQSHLNDGLVTITNVDTSIPLPSYAARSDFVCDPVTGKKVYNAASGLTQKKIYAVQSAVDTNSNTDSLGSSVSAKSYGTGPFVTDVFGLIPMKVSGLENGSTYVEFGGTLQNQERSYFGPVNIQRMTVRLVTDRGNLVDLNKANWSFSLICEQLNKLEPTKPTA